MSAATLRTWASRAAQVGLGLVALSAGLVVGSSGCLSAGCNVDPVQPGVFRIIGSPERPELVGGIVDASDDGVEISYTDAEGTAWVIEYSIDYKVGG